MMFSELCVEDAIQNSDLNIWTVIDKDQITGAITWLLLPHCKIMVDSAHTASEYY